MKNVLKICGLCATLFLTGCLFSSDDDEKKNDLTYASSIDLSAYALADSLSPNIAALTSRNDTLFAGLQRLDGWSVTAGSLILLIDAQKGTVLDTVSCSFGNISQLILDGSSLYAVNPGSAMADGDGGVEKISLSDLSVETLFTAEWDASAIALKSDGTFYAACSNTDFVAPQGQVVHVSAAGNADTIFSGAAVSEILWDDAGEQLYICEGVGGYAGVITHSGGTLDSIATTLNVGSAVLYDGSLWVGETDYNSGVYGVITDGAYTKKKPINQDHALTVAGGSVYILERYGADNIIRLTPDGAIEYQQSIGEEANPYAVTMVDGTGFLAPYGLEQLLAFDPATGVLE
ncbi:MAG: hypothetical protein ACQEQV_09410 [Fibrobacterota bacterium]